MINTSHINLLDLIGTDTTLKRVANTNNGEYHGPCPFCGGKDRFIVQPLTCEGGRWSCRQCTPRWQDAIAYVMRRDTNGSFKEALKVLELSTSRDMPRQNRPMSNVPGSLRKDYPALNEPGWQAGAQAFVTTAKRRLWSSAGSAALDYLRGRGLTDAVIEQANLGFCPSGQSFRWANTNVWSQRGIVIPWLIDGNFWRVRFRLLDQYCRSNADSSKKYTQVAGGANGLYNANALTPNCTAIIVESEFDALVLDAHTRHSGIVAVATGGTNNARLQRWIGLLTLAARILVAFDADENKAGDVAADWWLNQIGGTAKRLTPTRHDVTDMVLANDSLDDWLASAI